jgi:phage shock protein PspC (stress-responsive transcriptional regulator)
MGEFKLISKDECISGVCAGLAYALGVKTYLVRIATVLSVFLAGPVIILLYILLAMFVPEWDADPSDYEQICK